MAIEYETTSITIFMQGYNKFLHGHGLQSVDIQYHSLLAMAYLVKQSNKIPFMLEGYITKHKKLIQQHRSLWAEEEPLRVLPLTPTEREILIGTVATTGNSTALRLRNAAMVSVLMCPMPRGIRPDHVRRLTVNQLHMPAGPFTSWPTLGVTKNDKIKHLKFTKDRILSNGNHDIHIVDLDDRSAQHLSRYVMFADGWPSIKHWGSEFLFLPIGTKGIDIGKHHKYLSRQTVWKIVRQAGINAGITGHLYPDILRKQPLAKEGDK